MAGGQRLIIWLHPCSTGNVVLNMHNCAHGPLMGHPNWAGCDIHPPQRTRRPRRSNSPVQCRPIRHAVCPIPSPHAHAYVHTLTQPFLLAHDRTSSVDPYVMPCVPSQAHTHHAPYVCATTRVKGLTRGCYG
jgi:hypothetical protein